MIVACVFDVGIGKKVVLFTIALLHNIYEYSLMVAAMCCTHTHTHFPRFTGRYHSSVLYSIAIIYSVE